MVQKASVILVFLMSVVVIHAHEGEDHSSPEIAAVPAPGSNLVAIGIVTFKAVFGDFVGWNEALAGFIIFALIGFALLTVVRVVVDFVLFPRVKVAQELTVDRNLGVAFIEGAVVISVSLILFFAV